MRQENSFKRYTITAALPYANGPKHIGHLAGAYIPADIYARFLRLKQKDVLFVCGSDEHGTAIANQALNEKTTPQDIIDKYHQLNKKSFEQLGISFDIYHRTSAKIHHETAQEFFSHIEEKGLFEVQTTEQYYDEKNALFLADRYIMGTCPKCNNPNAYGDQCEKCGSSLSPEELIQPHSTLSGEKPILKATKHWYLPLNKYEKWLSDWILVDHKNDWRPNVYGQCKSWIDAGLHPRAVTRDLDWGIKVPLKDAKGKVLYVWFDAPIGYVSATKQWAIDHKKDWKPYWQDADTKLVHFIGKDNIVFHCLIFPVILHLQGNYILPENVPANEFMNLEGDKMSTSRGWSIEMHEYLEDFPNKVDELRYVLTAIAPETGDSEFTWKDYQARVNNELVAILGNLVNRVMVLMHKFYEGQVLQNSELKHAELKLQIEKIHTELAQSIWAYKFRNAQNLAMEIARLGNRYLTENEPWKTIKTEPEKAQEVLLNCLHIIAHLANAIQPFMPNTAKKIFQMIAIEPADSYRFTQGHQLKAPILLFDKIDDEDINKQLIKLQNKKLKISTEITSVHRKTKANISFDDFSAMDIVVGTILSAEKIQGTQKLLKLSVDVGFETRTIVSGIAEHYEPNSIIGQQVSVLLNLEPRNIKGVSSQGMILMTEDNSGKLSFVIPSDKVANGSGIS